MTIGIEKAAKTYQFFAQDLNLAVEDIKNISRKLLEDTYIYDGSRKEVDRMIGVKLDRPATPIVQSMMQRGFLIGKSGDHVLRFLPPLVIDQADLLTMLDSLKEVLQHEST